MMIETHLKGNTVTGVPSDTHVYLPEFITPNVNPEHRFTRRLADFTVSRPIANKPRIEERYGSVTPNHARISNYQHLGPQISIGVKGRF